MIVFAHVFRVRLTEIPKNAEGQEIGKFRLGRKYKVRAVYDNEKFTDFLLEDDERCFHWIGKRVCRGV